MTEKFNLSNRIWFPYQVEGLPNGNDVIFVHDVKEFIKRLKEEIRVVGETNEQNEDYDVNCRGVLDCIDRLAGEKLVK